MSNADCCLNNSGSDSFDPFSSDDFLSVSGCLTSISESDFTPRIFLISLIISGIPIKGSTDEI